MRSTAYTAPPFVAEHCENDVFTTETEAAKIAPPLLPCAFKLTELKGKKKTSRTWEKLTNTISEAG